MLYEYILTVDDELELVWRRRVSLSSWLLFANRATLLFVVVDWVVRNANTSVKHFTFSDRWCIANNRYVARCQQP